MKMKFKKENQLFTTRLLTLLLVVVIGVSSAGVLPVCADEPMSFTPTDDAYIHSHEDHTNGNTNFGSAETLVLKRATNENYRKIFMKFDISALGDSVDVTEATLTMTGYAAVSPTNIEIFGLEDNDWDQGTITWKEAFDSGLLGLTGYNSQLKDAVKISEPIAIMEVRNTNTNAYKPFTADLTKYIADQVDSGKTTISLVIETSAWDGNGTANFASTESTKYPNGKPSLKVAYQAKTGTGTETTASITDVTTIAGGYQIDYDITLSSDADSSVNYVALYNSNELIAVREVSKDESAVDILTDKAATKAVIFAWNNLNDMMPLCPSDDYAISN